MFKIGDKVVCKCFPKNKDDVTIDGCSDLIIGNYYLVVDANKRPITKNLNIQMLGIMGERKQICWYWSDYFFSKNELRLLKLHKICSRLGIK